MMKVSEHNEKVFSRNTAVYEVDYWRPDEEEAVKFLTPGKLLIGGVGAGRTVGHLLEKQIFEITAVDISPEMVKACKQRWPQIDVLVMDLQQTSFPNEFFKAIYLPFNTMACVDDLDITLKEMHRILKPGGTLLFTMPNFWYVGQILDGTIFKGKRQFVQITRQNEDSVSLRLVSMFQSFAMRRVFPFVRVRGRVSLQHLKNPNWKDRVLAAVPFIDKQLYFFCRKG
jgi:ubiquinone/menaquinone biosynthesis C-methylase UbiE